MELNFCSYGALMNSEVMEISNVAHKGFGAGGLSLRKTRMILLCLRLDGTFENGLGYLSKNGGQF